MRNPLIALLLLLLLPACARAQTLTESAPLTDPVSGVAYDAAGFRWWISTDTTIAGKIAPDGQAVARYMQSGTGNGAGPKRDSNPAEIVAGPGGLLWFTESGNTAGGIGRIDPTTGQFSQLEIPNSGDVDTLAEKATSGIFFEPPNTVWFTLPTSSYIGKATWSALGTTTVTLKKLPCCSKQPHGIAVGADGFLYIATALGVARANPALDDYSGASPADFTIFDEGLDTFEQPNDVTPGSDGNVWFTVTGQPKLGRITPAGTITPFPLPAGTVPANLLLGADGNVWATATRADRIVRVTPAGEVAEFALAPNSGPNGIANGPGGVIGFAETTSKRLGQLPNDLSPGATTGSGNPSSPTSATLEASVHPRAVATSYTFEHGTTDAYGTQTPALPAGNADAASPVSAAIADLKPATTYHFRVRATNAFGTTTGADQTFSTPAIPPPPEPPPPPVDADGDGLPVGLDCDDGNAARRLGAKDVPGNKLDEDCDGADAPFPLMQAAISVKWGFVGPYTLLALSLRELAGGERITIRCKGRGCPFKQKVVTAKKRGKLDLSKLFRRAKLSKSARVEISVSSPAWVGRFMRVVIRGRRKEPKFTRLCVPATGRGTLRCPA